MTTMAIPLIGAPSSGLSKWDLIDWEPIEKHVKRLQMRIAKATCPIPCDYVPVRSYPLFRAREVLREIVTQIEERLT